MKVKMRQILYVSGIIVALFCVVVLAEAFSKSDHFAHAETTMTWESIVYTEPEAFQFIQLGNGNCSVKLIDKSKVNVRVPITAIIDDVKYNVTEIAANGFASAVALKTVIMPSIESIGSAAFQNCKNLELAYAPKVKSIGMGAFMLCPNLTDMIFPNTLETVGASIFMGNNTAIHARFDEHPNSWVTNWNSGNKIQAVDYNTRDENGDLWLHDFVYEEVVDVYSGEPNSDIKYLAPLQPYMESGSQGHLEISADETEILPGAFCNAVFDSITILSSEQPINIWSSAFMNLQVLEGFTINREVTYNCGFNGESMMPFNTVSTPFITLPAMDKIADGMFFYCSVSNINFRTLQGVEYENKGVVSLPDTVQVIGESAFEGVSGINVIRIPLSVTDIESKAFCDWKNTQTIELSFITELHAQAVLKNNEWQSDCKAKIEYAGDIYVVSQPIDIRDNSTYTISFEFKIKKNTINIDKLTYKRPYTYWTKPFVDEFDYSVIESDAEDEINMIHRWDYIMKIKDASIGGCAFSQNIQVFYGDILVAETVTEKITVQNLVGTVDQFNEFYHYIFDTYTNYDICLIDDINLGKFTLNDRPWGTGIAGNNEFRLFGNGHTIFYDIEFDTIPAGRRCNCSLFRENKNVISNLKIDCNINIKNAEYIKIDNTSFRTGSAHVGGIAYKNLSGALIDSCDVNINVYNNSYYAQVGGIVAENEGEITACTVQGKLEGTELKGGVSIGGIACHNQLQTASIKNCINKADMTGFIHMGGIVAFNNGVIDGSRNEGTLTYIYTYGVIENGIINYSIGGIAGYNEGDCIGCHNAGIIKYGGYLYPEDNVFIQPIMGQIVGTQISSGTLEDNTWTGKVDTTGLSDSFDGWYNQILYAKDSEYGKLE